MEILNAVPLWGWIVAGVSGVIYIGFTIADLIINNKAKKGNKE